MRQSHLSLPCLRRRTSAGMLVVAIISRTVAEYDRIAFVCRYDWQSRSPRVPCLSVGYHNARPYTANEQQNMFQLSSAWLRTLLAIQGTKACFCFSFAIKSWSICIDKVRPRKTPVAVRYLPSWELTSNIWFVFSNICWMSERSVWFWYGAICRACNGEKDVTRKCAIGNGIIFTANLRRSMLSCPEDEDSSARCQSRRHLESESTRSDPSLREPEDDWRRRRSPTEVASSYGVCRKEPYCQNRMFHRYSPSDLVDHSFSLDCSFEGSSPYASSSVLHCTVQSQRVT